MGGRKFNALGALQSEISRLTAVLSVKVLSVLNVRFATNGEPRSLEPANGELDAVDGHDFDRLFAQVIDKARDAENPLRNLRLKLCLARKDYNRFKGRGR